MPPRRSEKGGAVEDLPSASLKKDNKSLWNTVISILLSSIIGGFVGSYFQYKLWTDQQAADENSKQMTAAVSLYREMSSSLSKVGFHFWRAVLAQKNNIPLSTRQAMRDHYTSAAYEFVYHQSEYQVFIKFYFPEEVDTQFHNVLVGLYAMDKAIDESITSEGKLIKETGIQDMEKEFRAADIAMKNFNGAAVSA